MSASSMCEESVGEVEHLVGFELRYIKQTHIYKCTSGWLTKTLYMYMYVLSDSKGGTP